MNGETIEDVRQQRDDARAAISESLRIYQLFRYGNGGTNEITMTVVAPLQDYESGS